jgi:hypothetical protein
MPNTEGRESAAPWPLVFIWNYQPLPLSPFLPLFAYIQSWKVYQTGSQMSERITICLSMCGGITQDLDISTQKEKFIKHIPRAKKVNLVTLSACNKN